MPEIVQIDINHLILLEKNPRKISTEQMEKLCKSLKEDPEFFLNRPCLVHKKDGKLELYAGNQRVRAAKKLKYKTVPCIIEEDLPEKIIKKRIIKDNKTYGEFDFDILANEWEIDTLLDAGFTNEELSFQPIEEIINEEDENDVLEPGKDEDSQTKLGDIYELNSHRLVCGDSNFPEYVNKCLNDSEPILMVTDPPYGVEYDPSWRKDIKGKHGVAAKALGQVQNDDKVDWSLAWNLFPGSVAYIWCASWYLPEISKTLNNCNYEIKSLIIWIKQHFALSRGDYHWQHEPCWYAIKKGHQHNWQGSRKESTVWQISNLNCFGKSKEDGEDRTAHSTQKPIECMARPIRNNTAVGEGVYDPFLGSGTTLIAAEQLNRTCYGIELSPAYCDIIVDRWIKYMIKSKKEFTIKKNGDKQNV